MPSSTLKTTKSGKRFYEIRCHVSRSKGTFTRRWYVPDGWSEKAIQRELAKVSAEFERQCKAGEVLTRADQKAQEEEAQRLAELEAAKIVTLRQYCERVFMPALTVTAAENTRSGFQSCLDLRIYPAFGNVPMRDISAAQINSFLLDLQASGLSHSTAVKYYTLFNLIFKSAYLDDTIPANPMGKVQRPKPTKAEGKKTGVESYTADELQYILECLEREPLKWQAYMQLLIDTGIRRGECCALQWADIDFQAGTVTISRSAGYTPEAGIYTTTPKNGKTRSFDLSDEVLQLLRKLRAEQSQKAVSKWVFTQEGTAEMMHPQSPDRFMHNFAKHNGIEHLHPHKLRHSFASVAITNGADIASVSEKLGHSDKAVTLRLYTHADAESIKRAGNIFRDALKKTNNE